MTTEQPDEMPAGERIRIGDRLYWRENDQWIWSHVSGGWSAVYESTADLLDEIERLRAWKADATEVLIGWHDLTEEVFAALGQPARLLGKRGVDVVRAALGGGRDA